MKYPPILLVALLAVGAATHGQNAPAEGAMASIKKESRIFERIVGEVLKQNFDNPFALAAEPQAAYLPDYGIVVSFHLKINRGTIRAFYGPIINPNTTSPQTTNEQLETVKKTTMQALADYGNTIKDLPPGQQISICAQVEDRNELDTSKNRTDIIISVVKKDLDLYTMRKIDYDEFKRRVQLVEY
jgi:hypothetical protein